MKMLMVKLLKVWHRGCRSLASPLPLRNTKPKSNRHQGSGLVDCKRVLAVGGNGGEGCISLLQLWANESAGPDGGDGGNGAHIILQACANVSGLAHVNSVVRGLHGEKGYNKNCHGSSAQHTIIKVPLGTVVKESSGGRLLCDLSVEGSRFVLARGGAGGRGNAFFTSDTNQAPTVAQHGAVGESRSYILELKSIAHFGLVGMPNAGKSSLLQSVSRARPKVAPYPFTTLRPHLGTILYSDYTQLTLADLPGLVEGSHKNRGLGAEFLRHVERCSALLYVVDVTTSPLATLRLLQNEVRLFNPALDLKPSLVIANKIDLSHCQEELEELESEVGQRGAAVLRVSAKLGTNLASLLAVVRRLYDQLSRS